MNKKDFKTGMTLVELMVAFGVFSVLIVIASGVLIRSLRISRFTSSQSNAINNVALTIEEIAREARTGYGFTSGSGPQIIYNNYKGDQVTYRFVDGTSVNGVFVNGSIEKKVIDKSGNQVMDFTKVTDPTINVTGSFNVVDYLNGHQFTPRITVIADVTANSNPLVHMETSVSARLIYYKP